MSQERPARPRTGEEPSGAPAGPPRAGIAVGEAGGGCWTCARFVGELVAGGLHVVCRLEPAAPRVISQPRRGCAAWMREPGADDELRP